MTHKIVLLAIALVFICPAAFASQDPVTKELQGALDTFTEGCQQELTTYCKDVTPGEGRVLACLYAFQDKLTPRCEHAFFDSVMQLDRTINNLVYAVSQCAEDLDKHCADVQPGEGRLIQCLEQNEDKVSKSCFKALEEVGYTD